MSSKTGKFSYFYGDELDSEATDESDDDQTSQTNEGKHCINFKYCLLIFKGSKITVQYWLARQYRLSQLPASAHKSIS